MKRLFIFTILALLSNFSAHSKTADIKLNLEDTPFAYAGSYSALMQKEGKLVYTSLAGNYLWLDNTIFEFVFTTPDGEIISEYEIEASPYLIEVKTKFGNARICYECADVLRVRSQNIEVRLVRKNGAEPPAPTGNEQQWRWKFGNNSMDYLITVLEGGNIDFNNDRMLLKPNENNVSEFVIHDYCGGVVPGTYSVDFDKCVVNARKSFDDFLTKAPGLPTKYYSSHALAAYIEWSCTVHKRGLVKRTIMYSSKNKMHATWSWDHCFYAISAAMSNNQEDRAWDLWRQVFDHQDDETGMIADAYSNYTLYYGTYKPPVHGWALMKMIQANPKILTKERIEDAYSVLTKWTNFWFKYQDDNRNGIPNYNIGCDSGWDNATVFMVNAGSGLEAPDLCAYLVLQMETLAYLADEMGNKKESKQWTSRSKELLNRLVNELWNGELFAYRRTSDLMLSTTQSLIHYMPLLLGDRLPKEISNKMVNDLKTKGFFTKYGFASEHPDSEHFVEDGYWQGALWSPPTLMLSYGARDVGDEDFAKEIVERFCNTCNEFGFPENFSALTGKPLRDMSLPWMSSVFMILGHDFLNEK